MPTSQGANEVHMQDSALGNDAAYTSQLHFDHHDFVDMLELSHLVTRTMTLDQNLAYVEPKCNQFDFLSESASSTIIGNGHL